MRRFATSSGFILFIVSSLLFMAGCGGGSSSSSTKVAAVTIAPTALSLNSGDVVQLTPTATNAAGTAVSNTTFTFTSSNPSVISVSPGSGTVPGGLVCGGVWDANFVVCNGNDASGNPISGTANITVTASGVTSAPTTAAVHPKVTSVTVDPVPVANCAFSGEVLQLTAHAFHNGADITSSVGPFTWSTLDPSVATVDTNGSIQAKNPGATGVFATNSNASSTAVTFNTCMPHQLILRVASDPAGSPTTAPQVTATGGTVALAVDMVDVSGVFKTITTVPLTSTSPINATVTGLTVTAASPGSTGLVASCAPPLCGNGIAVPVYSNVVSLIVSGASPASTAYVSSSFTPPAGVSPTLIPVATDTHTAGTAITLPGAPNSLVFNASGSRAYMGTPIGLVALDPTANTATTVASNLLGKVLAVSPDGTRVIVSTGANDPGTGAPIDPTPANQRAILFDQTSSTLQTFFLPGVVAATFDFDNFKAYMAANDGHVYVLSPFSSLQTITVGGSPADIAPLASDDFVFIANSGSLDALAVCNNQQQSAFLSTAHQLVKPVLNQDVMVAASATGLDIDRVTVGPPAAANAFCPPTASHSVQSVNFGLGTLTARQLLVAPSGVHFLELPAGINKLLVSNLNATPTVISLPAGVTEPLSGSMLPDGASAWVGMGGTNTVDLIDLNANADTAQVATSFKKIDGTPAPPNIVSVRPK